MLDIVIIEDNEELGSLIRDFLIKENYQVQLIHNAEDAIRFLEAHTVRLLLVDIMLEHMNGFQLCEKIRKHTSIPIMIMSAKNELSDKIMGYDLGADDYIEKPFDIALLLAKIKAQLRRSYDFNEVRNVISDGDLIVDISAREVYMQHKKLNFPIKEFELLALLMRHKGTTLRKEYLFQEVWGNDSESELSTLTVHINKIREKIEKNPKQPSRIITVWGIGYRYETVS